MSIIPVDPSLGINRLRDEGYEVAVHHGYLVLSGIPYVTAQREVARGTLVASLNGNMEALSPPCEHQVWFAGKFPCFKSGAPLEGIRNSSERRTLWESFEVQHHLSNKPCGSNGYPDYYSKMTNYIRLISNEARALDPEATPRTFAVYEPVEDDSVFRYHDSASSRADIVGISAKLKVGKVAIVGLGGTGSYVLDFVAKTQACEIHLFDRDEFLQHNAFRSPGAASGDTLRQKLPKVVYYAQIYDAMRKGIVPHPEHLTDDNVHQLAGFDFVFLCVDKGPVRRLVSEYLQAQGIPFVDVGMDLRMVPGESTLFGTCRTTMSTPAQSEHFAGRVPMGGGPADDLYSENIQVVEINALNAAYAVIQWKQHCGFYQNLAGVHHLTYGINAHALIRNDMTSPGAKG